MYGPLVFTCGDNYDSVYPHAGKIQWNCLPGGFITDKGLNVFGEEWF